MKRENKLILNVVSMIIITIVWFYCIYRVHGTFLMILKIPANDFTPKLAFLGIALLIIGGYTILEYIPKVLNLPLDRIKKLKTKQ